MEKNNLKPKIFLPVSVNERNPVRTDEWAKSYACLLEGKKGIAHRLFEASDTWQNNAGIVTHWLEEKENVFVFDSLQEAAIECIKEMQKKIDAFAEKETSDFNKGVYYSHFGDLNTAISVLEMYNERKFPTP